MNSSDNPGQGDDGIQSWIDPDLEARIVASVVGEASDFERAELDRMLEANPELAVFKRRIEAVHGLVGESYARKPVSDDDQWRLAPERRGRLLATLGLKSADSGDEEAAAEVTVIEPERKGASWKIWAACVPGVAAALVAVCAVVVSLVQSRSSILQSRFIATKEAAAIDSVMPMEPDTTTFATTDEWAYRPAPSSGLAEAPAAPAATEGSGRYRKTLRQLADATSLGDTESLITQTERPTLQASGRTSELGRMNIDGSVKTSDEVVRGELALVPAQSQPAMPESIADQPTVTTGPAIEQDDKQVAAADVSLGLPVLPAPMEQTTGESVDDLLVANAAVEYESVSDGLSDIDAKNASPAGGESKLAEVEPVEESGDVDVAQGLGGAQLGSMSEREFDQPGIPELQVAQNDKDGDHLDRSAGQQSSDPANTGKFFFARSERELVEQSTLTRSGQETSVELTRDFVEPGEYGINEPGDVVDSLELAGKPVVPRDAFSEPFSTAGKVELGYEVLAPANSTRANGTELGNGPGLAAEKQDGYSIDLAAAPEVIEFEGFVNDREMLKGAELQVEGEKSDLAWYTPEVEGVQELTEATTQPQSGEYQRYPFRSASTSLSSVTFPNESEPAVAAISKDGLNGGMAGGGAESQRMSQPRASSVSAEADGEEARSLSRASGSLFAAAEPPVSGIVAEAKLGEVVQLGKKLKAADQVINENGPAVAFDDGAVVEDLARADSGSAADLDLFGTTVDRSPEQFGNEGAEVMPSAEPARAGDGITLREKNAGTMSFGAGFSAIDNLDGLIDNATTNFDSAGLGAAPDGAALGEEVAGEPVDLAGGRIAESLVADESGSLEQLKAKLSAFGRGGSVTGDFDTGVGNAPDGAAILQPETEPRFGEQQSVLEEARGEVGKDALELAETNAAFPLNSSEGDEAKKWQERDPKEERKAFTRYVEAKRAHETAKLLHDDMLSAVATAAVDGPEAPSQEMLAELEELEERVDVTGKEKEALQQEFDIVDLSSNVVDSDTTETGSRQFAAGTVMSRLQAEQEVSNLERELETVVDGKADIKIKLDRFKEALEANFKSNTKLDREMVRLHLARQERDSAQTNGSIPGTVVSNYEVFRENSDHAKSQPESRTSEQRLREARTLELAAKEAILNQDWQSALEKYATVLRLLPDSSADPAVRALRESLIPEYRNTTEKMWRAEVEKSDRNLRALGEEMVMAALDPTNLPADATEDRLRADVENLAAQLETLEALRGDALIEKVLEVAPQSNPFLQNDIRLYQERVPQPQATQQVTEGMAATRERLNEYAADYLKQTRIQLRAANGRLKALKERDNLDDVGEISPEFAPVTTTEELASTNAFSTFSLNVSDVAFKLAQSALMKGEWPEPEKVRVEEFVNALDYGDPAPATGEKVMCRTEQCAHPFMQQRNLLRIAMRTAAVGRGGGQPLRLTILLDNSGSMQREDREASVRRAMEVLAAQLQPNDQVSLLGFARTPRLLADRVSGSDGAKLLAAVDDAPSEGGTNLEEAMRLAAEVAQRQFDDGAVNRIVLMTDGAANLGNADPEELATRVVELRQKGIAFDACGVGANGLNDEVLEALTRKGDGRYYFLDAPEQADSGFASQLAGALRPAAKNVKVQVVFNPQRVGAYRLIGYEKHRLKKEDFRNDAVDAAEMAAEETGVAVYQIEPMADGSGDVGEVRVRFQDVASGRMVEHSWIIPYEENAPTIEVAKPSIQLAGVAAMLGEYLRGGPEASNVDLDALSSLAPGLRSAYGDNVRVNQLIGMIRDAQMAK
ncbi:MAG: von Willebrand factor type A domain-containing protein [Verrucomicrobiae bacterium]|nr:von Willebrand factor type A domain-containing protein [Verrucomicrobiae bacterium]